MGRLSEHLIERKLVTRSQLDEAVQHQVLFGGRLGTNLVELGRISVDELAQALSETTSTPLPTYGWLESPEPDAVAMVSRPLVERFRFVPLRLEGRLLHVAVMEPDDAEMLDALRGATSCRLKTYVLPEVLMQDWLEWLFQIPRAIRQVDTSLQPQRRSSIPSEPEDASAAPSPADAPQEASERPPSQPAPRRPSRAARAAAANKRASNQPAAPENAERVRASLQKLGTLIDATMGLDDAPTARASRSPRVSTGPRPASDNPEADASDGAEEPAQAPRRSEAPQARASERTTASEPQGPKASDRPSLQAPSPEAMAPKSVPPASHSSRPRPLSQQPPAATPTPRRQTIHPPPNSHPPSGAPLSSRAPKSEPSLTPAGAEPQARDSHPGPSAGPDTEAAAEGSTGETAAPSTPAKVAAADRPGARGSSAPAGVLDGRPSPPPTSATALAGTDIPLGALAAPKPPTEALSAAISPDLKETDTSVGRWAAPDTGAPVAAVRPAQLSDIEAAMARAGDRRELIGHALSASTALAEFGALFAVHRGAVEGLVGLAAGASMVALTQIRIDLSSPSPLATAAHDQAPVQVVQEDDAESRAFRDALGRPMEGELPAMVLPILVRGRLVNLLYVDNGGKPLAESSRAGLVSLAKLIGGAYGLLILRMKGSTH